MRISPAYYGALILGSSLLYSAAAFAQPSGCNFNSGRPNYLPYESSLLNIQSWIGWESQVTVPSNAAVGSVIKTFVHYGLPNLENMSQKDAARYIALANCSAGRIETFKLVGFPTNIWNVYRKGPNDNIGYRVTYPGWGSSSSFTFTSGGQGTTTVPNGRSLYMLYPPPGTMYIEFILLSHTWPASRAVSVSGLVADTDVDGWGSGTLLRYNVPFPITFVPEPCYFTSSTVINLNLDPVDAERFTGVGTALNHKDVPLMRMRCSGVSAQPKISINGIADTSGTPGVLKNLATNSPATGVGILLEHKPPSIQPYPADLSGGTQVPSVGLVNDGSCGSNCTNWSLPMRASYYSTSSTVVSGAVSARVTVDVTYP